MNANLLHCRSDATMSSNRSPGTSPSLKNVRQSCERPGRKRKGFSWLVQVIRWSIWAQRGSAIPLALWQLWEAQVLRDCLAAAQGHPSLRHTRWVQVTRWVLANRAIGALARSDGQTFSKKCSRYLRMAKCLPALCRFHSLHIWPQLLKICRSFNRIIVVSWNSSALGAWYRTMSRGRGDLSEREASHRRRSIQCEVICHLSPPWAISSEPLTHLSEASFQPMSYAKPWKKDDNKTKKRVLLKLWRWINSNLVPMRWTIARISRVRRVRRHRWISHRSCLTARALPPLSDIERQAILPTHYYLQSPFFNIRI